jgi:hypothetical protein
MIVVQYKAEIIHPLSSRVLPTEGYEIPISIWVPWNDIDCGLEELEEEVKKAIGEAIEKLNERREP